MENLVLTKLRHLRSSGRLIEKQKIPPNKMLPEMPVFIGLLMTSGLSRATVSESDGEVKFLQSFDSVEDESWTLLEGTEFANVPLLRDEFFAVSTPAEALTFLESWPHFYVQPESVVQPRREMISWRDFRNWQWYFGQKLRGAPLSGGGESSDELFGRMLFGDRPLLLEREEATLINGAPDLRLETVEREGRAVLQVWIHCESTSEAIAASIFLDHLARVENQECRQCGRLFNRYERSRHARFFCNPKCTKKFHKKKGKIPKVK